MLNKRLFLPLILLVILGLFVYGKAINGKFIWDDESLIQDNLGIRDFSKALNLYTQDIGGGGYENRYGFYRPFTMTVYAVEYFLGKLNVEIYHITNIIVHILTAFSVYLLVSLILNNSPVALLTGVLFLIHPVQTEAVAYISGLGDPLVALFLIWSFIFYIKYLSSRKKTFYVLALFTYFLAFLSKENSLVFPATILLYHYAFKKKLRIKEFLPVLFMTFLYLVLRFTLLKSALPQTEIIYWQVWIRRVPGFFAAISNYIRILILPFDLHMGYGNRFFKLYDYRVITGFVMASSLLGYAFLRRKKDSLLLFSAFWFFITLLPSSSIYPINAFYMAEHWLYLPLVGFCLMIAKWLSDLYKNGKLKKWALFLMFCVTLFWSVLTMQQCGYWRDPETFYKRILRYAPWYPQIYYNLGRVYDNIGRRTEATAMYKKAIELKPKFSSAYSNLGNIYYCSGRYSAAVKMYKKAIESNPKCHTSYNNLGTAYGNMGDLAGAVAMYKKAIENEPDYADAYFNLAVTYFEMKEYVLAIKNCDKAAEFGYSVPPPFLKQLEPYKK